MSDSDLAGVAGEVLLVEDDMLVAELARSMLEELGLSIHCASNGREALDLFRAHPGISLLMTDIRMPVMDGKELVRAVLQTHPDLPVIFVTAYADVEDISSLFPILYKPYCFEELKAMVLRVMAPQPKPAAKQAAADEAPGPDLLDGLAPQPA